MIDYSFHCWHHIIFTNNPLTQVVLANPEDIANSMLVAHSSEE